MPYLDDIVRVLELFSLSIELQRLFFRSFEHPTNANATFIWFQLLIGNFYLSIEAGTDCTINCRLLRLICSKPRLLHSKLETFRHSLGSKSNLQVSCLIKKKQEYNLRTETYKLDFSFSQLVAFSKATL